MYDRKGRQLHPGDRVRVKTYPKGTVEGVLVVSDRTLVVVKGKTYPALVVKADNGTLYSNYSEKAILKIGNFAVHPKGPNMEKIATPNELQSELRRLLSYSQEAHPSRVRLASELRELALKVAAAPTAEELTKPLTTGAIVMFDPYPWVDEGNLKLEAGVVVLEVLEQYLSRQLKEPVKLSPSSRHKGSALLVNAEKGSEKITIEVSLRRLKR